ACAQPNAAPQFTCGHEPGARSSVEATFRGTEVGSVSDILGAVYGTSLPQKPAASPVSETECRRLVATLTSTDWGNLADTAVSFYKIKAAGGQPHVFAAYAAPVFSTDPGIIEIAEDLVFVLDAGYTLLFYTLAANPAHR
ncbi:MAG TPA: hypothetical protein VF594_12310, partial [Rubricoccaceae bacterium]